MIVDGRSPEEWEWRGQRPLGGRVRTGTGHVGHGPDSSMGEHLSPREGQIEELN